ncbi:heat stress transcription factor A-9 isoform X2 [Oryza brachyantha]|nr:heat stress transcription factor A-9 isoform X2 [Oryza brachyantha]XP_040378639.1 heat stress transcription factor A-9 isoform X2 [Oryza brachyantha]
MGSKKRSPQHPAASDVAASSPAPSVGGSEVSGDAGAPTASGGAVVPKPSEVAPFLTKVYDMVSDPATDKVISWAEGGGSFVIWDSHAFERDLHRHFKHSNFTSFIRQLNTYGFRKVHPDRWEWANEGFIMGQKHLLKTIKRRKKSSQEAPSEIQKATVKTAPGTENIEIGKYGGLEKEVETLKRDKALLMQQLVDLRHYQQTSNLEVQNLIERLQVMEQNQQQMMALLAIVVQNPSFLNQLVQQQQQQRRTSWWNPDGSKKRRFHALEQGPVTDQETSGRGAQIIEYLPTVPETSGQVTPMEGAICSQPVPSPAVATPMDMQTTSNIGDTLGSSEEPFTDNSTLHEWDDSEMQLLFDDNLDPILPPFENDGQVEAPLSIQDYDFPQLEQDCLMEAQYNCNNPQYADVITEA